MRHCKLMFLAILFTSKDFTVGREFSPDHQNKERPGDLLYEWKGCYTLPTKWELENRYGFELLLKGNISEFNITDWKRSISEFACRCARMASQYNLTVFTLQFPSLCYGREEISNVNRSSRTERNCERQNQSLPCRQSRSLCIGLKTGVSIYSLAENFTALEHYNRCPSVFKGQTISKNKEKQSPNGKISYSIKESTQSLKQIYSTLTLSESGSANADEILNLIKEAIEILKRPEIYQDLKVFKKYEQLFMDILSQIVDEPFKDMWMKSQKIHRLVTLVEDVARTLLSSLEFAKLTSANYYYPTPNIDIVANFTNDHEGHSTIDFNDTAIFITSLTSGRASFGTSAIIYKGIKDFFPSSKESSHTTNEPPMRVASHVISIVAAHDGKAIHRVNGTIRFKVDTNEKISENNFKDSLCVFWNENANMSLGGVWSSHGLSLIDTYHNNYTNDTYYTCQSNHLTNFAILMETSDYQISRDDKIALEIITYVGCTLSLFCLLLTIFTLPWIRLREVRFKIHLHLCIALAAAQIVFLAGINAVAKKIPCMIVAILLHYLYTVAFLWMLVEGIHLYQKVVIAYEKKSIKKKHYYLIAWGSPVIIVGISAAVRRDGYGTSKGCWLSLQDGFRWAFIGPALFVMMMNIIILIRVLTVMVNLRSDPLKKQKYAKIRAALKGVVILLPLLGLTWLFGLMSVNSDTIVFQYLFSIFNSLQGAFIFVFNYVLNKEVRASFRRTLHRTTTTSL